MSKNLTSKILTSKILTSKNILIVCLLFLLLFLTSCVTITDDEQKFVDKLYKQQTEKITDSYPVCRSDGHYRIRR